MQWDLVRLLAKQAAWFLPERLWMKTSLFVTFLAMKKVRDNLSIRSFYFRSLSFELKFIVNEFSSVIGGGHRSRFQTLKQRTKSKFHLKTGIKIRALKHPQGNKLKWRKCEPRVWGDTTSWGEHPESSVAFRGLFYSPRPFCYFLWQCPKVNNI
jgi:hypothetical protein